MYILAVLLVVIMVGTAGILATKRYRKTEEELFRVKEIPMTALLGFLLWLEAGAILYVVIAVPENLIKSSRSFWNVVIFILLSSILGAVMILYYFIKSCIVSEKGIKCISLIGTVTELSWQEVSSVKVSTGKRLILESADGKKKVTVGGEKKSYQEFIRLAEKRMKPVSGREYLHN